MIVVVPAGEVGMSLTDKPTAGGQLQPIRQLETTLKRLFAAV